MLEINSKDNYGSASDTSQGGVIKTRCIYLTETQREIK